MNAIKLDCILYYFTQQSFKDIIYIMERKERARERETLRTEKH